MQADRIHVRDVMKPEVVRLDAGTSVSDAIAALQDAGIHGAPVVDTGGEVVGVVSIADLLAASAAEPGDVGSTRREYYLADPLEEAFDEEVDEFEDMLDYSPEALESGTVAEWMSERVLSIEPGATLERACRMMAEHKVHRLMVIENRQLAGILTTFDVVACVAERS